MSNTSAPLWALGAFTGAALLAFACSSDTVGSESQVLAPTSDTSGAVTTGTTPDGSSGSGVGGAQGAVGSTATTGQSVGDGTTVGNTASGPTTGSTTSTTGDAAVTTTGDSGPTGAGGSSSVTPGLSTTTGGDGGAATTTDASTTDATSAAAGGTSSVVDDPECEEFCDLFFEACADEVADSFFADDLYPDHDSCMTACVTFEKGGNYGSDTLGCRRAHIVDNPDGGVHCTHASESGGGQCPPEQ